MKRRKTVRAGRLVYDTVYTVASPHAPDYIRKKQKQISSRAIELNNCNTAMRKLELRMAANFVPSDLVITLTYNKDSVPADYKAAQRLLSKFLRLLRKHREARGQELKYIYVTEGLHGEHRIHHHIIINSTSDDLEVIRSLWTYGDQIDLKYIRDKAGYGGSGYSGWAGYLSKERREGSLNGKRMFVPSRNLKHPIITYEWVDDGATVEAPPGAQNVVESGDRNEYASFRSVKYLLPDHLFGQVKSSGSLFSGSKHTITNGQRQRKRRKRVDKQKKADKIKIGEHHT